MQTLKLRRKRSAPSQQYVCGVSCPDDVCAVSGSFLDSVFLFFQTTADDEVSLDWTAVRVSPQQYPCGVLRETRLSSLRRSSQERQLEEYSAPVVVEPIRMVVR
jgi:hypothetical protein